MLRDGRHGSHLYLSWLLLTFLGPLLALSITIAATATTLDMATPAYAQGSDLDRQVREIGADLRCPVCQNLSVADSPSPLAGEMRAIIRQKLEAGESRRAIMQYFVDRYGASILLNPPQQGFTLLVWLGAAAAVVGGAALLALRLRFALAPGSRGGTHSAYPAVSTSQRAESIPCAPGKNDQNDLNDSYEAALDTELEQYKQGVRM